MSHQPIKYEDKLQVRMEGKRVSEVFIQNPHGLLMVLKFQ